MLAPKQFNTLVFIGRFQPFHNGHLHVITEAAKLADKVLVLIGSSNVARSPKNPWTYSERALMIRAACEGLSVITVSINDHPYNDDAWIVEVQTAIDEWTSTGKVGLVGYSKDGSSYYLKMFPHMPSIEIPSQWGVINASDVRSQYFQNMPHIPADYLPRPVTDYLNEFYYRPEFKWLLEEAIFYRNYDPRKFNITIACSDAVITQSGHILLITRKKSPGKKLLALPGGHKEPDETFLQAMCREAKEETQLVDDWAGSKKKAMPEHAYIQYVTGSRMFDNPDRSERGCVITMAYRLELPRRTELAPVRGDDDAERASWYPLATLDPTRMYEDHFHIISEMTKGAI